MSAASDLDDIDQRLVRIVRHAATHSPFYGLAYSKAGVDLDALGGRHDLFKLPIIEPQALIAHHEEFRARGTAIYRITSSSGTSRTPKTLHRTSQDSDTSSAVLVRLLTSAGLKANDVLVIGQPFDLAHLGYLTLEACRRMSIVGIPVGISIPDIRLMQILEQHAPTAVFTSPSRMVQLTSLAKNVDKNARPPLAHILLAGEPSTPKQRQAITDFWGIVPHDLYGSEETDGLAGSCPERNGLHVMDDLFVMEIVDPETDRPAHGNVGQLVVTSLYHEGTPLIRYRLGDNVEVLSEPCRCGRTSPRIRVQGRPDDSIVVYDGIKLRAYQIQSALQQVVPVVPRFQAVCRSPKTGFSEIELILDCPPPAQSETMAEEITRALWHSSLDLPAAADIGCLAFRITFGPPLVTPRGKVPTFLDLRNF